MPRSTTLRLACLTALLLGMVRSDPCSADALSFDGAVPFASDQPWPIDPPKLVESPTNRVVRPKVLVLDFSPRIASEGNRRLWEVFGWHNPRELAAGFVRDLAHISGGAVQYEVVEWRELDEFPVFTDGTRYAPSEYIANRRIGPAAPWKEGTADFYQIAREHGFAKLVNEGKIDEVWLFGDHYFNLLGEDWMAGPGAFFINGSVFPDFPTDRAFAGYGFNYERHTAEMIHNLAHRTENHMRRAYGRWDMAEPRTPWDRFTTNLGKTGGKGPFGVGNCHYPPNGRRDYDYTNPDPVESSAPDWISYPNLTGKTSLIDLTAWAVDGTKRGPVNSGVGKGFEHLQYQRWLFSHLPRADGKAPDGRQNNWFKYVFDFNAYAADTGLPRENEAVLSYSDDVSHGANPREVRVRIYNTRDIDLDTLDDDDVEVRTENGTVVGARLVSPGERQATTAGVARTIRYELASDLPPGNHVLRLRAGVIHDQAGAPVAEAHVEIAVKADPNASSRPAR